MWTLNLAMDRKYSAWDLMSSYLPAGEVRKLTELRLKIAQLVVRLYRLYSGWQHWKVICRFTPSTLWCHASLMEEMTPQILCFLSFSLVPTSTRKNTQKFVCISVWVSGTLSTPNISISIKSNINICLYVLSYIIWQAYILYILSYTINSIAKLEYVMIITPLVCY